MAKKADNPKNGKRDETLHVSVLIDESGSMGGREEAVTTGFNGFLAELRDGEAKAKARVSLAMFDLSGNEPVTRVKVDNVPLPEVTDIAAMDYRPRGATPLNDAVVATIRRLDKRIDRGDRAVMVVLTDGYENASETTTRHLRKLVLEKERAGWEFIYLGANQDSWAESQKFAMAAPGKSFDFDATNEGINEVWELSADRVKTFRDAPERYEAEGRAMGRKASEENRKRRR
jgi:Mg-chelatase subunit ChlD